MFLIYKKSQVRQNQPEFQNLVSKKKKKKKLATLFCGLSHVQLLNSDCFKINTFLTVFHVGEMSDRSI